MKISDRVVCVLSGVSGVITKIYTPTASEMQIMVRTDDGRLYHAPYSTWRLEAPTNDPEDVQHWEKFMEVKR